MTKKSNNSQSSWSFRREITLGTLLHLAALVVLLGAGWSNLQQELALIENELAQLVDSHAQLQHHIKTLSDQCLDHEYRLRALEKRQE